MQRALMALFLVVLPIPALANTRLHFAPPAFVDNSAIAASIAVADVNGDGALDIVAAVAHGVVIYYGDMRGGVLKIELISMPARPQTIALADVNHDGVPDILTATIDGLWVSRSSRTQYAAPGRLYNARNTAALAAADVNGDGSIDVMTGAADGVAVTLDDRRQRFASSAMTSALAAGDLNGDGHPDLVTADGRSKSLFVRFGDGRGAFGPEQIVSTSDAPRAIAIGDFDGDGKRDLATANGFTHDLALLLGDGTGRFADPARIDAGGVPAAIAAGDLDRDGHQDLVVAFSARPGIAILANMTQRPLPNPPASDRGTHVEALRPAPLRDVIGCDVSYAFIHLSPDGRYLWGDPLNWFPHHADCGRYRVRPGSAGAVIRQAARGHEHGHRRVPGGSGSFV